jgi:amino acid transporter
VTTFTALSYGELASSIPKSGGGYAYVREAFRRDSVAFVVGWTRWFTYMAAGALYALGFSSNFAEFVHLYWAGLPTGPVVAGGPSWHVVYAVLVVALFVLLNALSTEASGGAETLVTVVKVVILLVFAAFGAFAVDLEAFTPFLPEGPMAILPAMGLTFIAFQGYDLTATLTEEGENPRVNIPRAIFISLGMTVVIYLVVVAVALGSVGAGQLAEAGETGIARAAGSFMPSVPLLGTGASLVAFGAVFSTVSTLNAVVIGSNRVAFAMGRERQLPRAFGRIHPRFGTPVAALAASAAVMLLATFTAPIRLVGNLASLFTVLGFVVVNASLIKLRRERPATSRPFEVPFYPFTPLAGIGLNLLLGLYIEPTTWLVAVGWLALGLAVYVLLVRGRSESGPPTPGAQEP